MYYANFSTKLVKRNFKLHDPDSPLLIGDVNDDVVKEVREPSYIDTQQKIGLISFFEISNESKSNCSFHIIMLEGIDSCINHPFKHYKHCSSFDKVAYCNCQKYSETAHFKDVGEYAYE